jgi:hypothetical protein
MNRCAPVAGRSCNGGTGSCNGNGMCVQNCVAGQPCGSNNQCTTGRTVCNPSGCQQTSEPNGKNCGQNGICNNGTCRECTGSRDVRCNGACTECCNNNSSQCTGGELCQGTVCSPPPCGSANQACCEGEACNGNTTCLVIGPQFQLTCVPCGAIGQPCCFRRFGDRFVLSCTNGNACSDSNECVSHCGDLDEQCCDVSNGSKPGSNFCVDDLSAERFEGKCFCRLRASP